jgi:hypothetical protein
MTDGQILLLLSIPAGLAFAFGIWAGLGYPGLYDKYERTGRAPREAPLKWLIRGGRRPRTSELAEQERLEQEAEELASREKDEHRPRFDRGRRFSR